MKILFISPGTVENIDSKIIREIPYMDSAAFFAPHAIAAIAAVTPEKYDVHIHDEYMKGPIEIHLEKNDYDIIGISLTTNQLKRSIEIVDFCRKMKPSALLVAGGIGVQNLMEKLKNIFDVVFLGESEETWPIFLLDYENEDYNNFYQGYSKPDMKKTPIPRWDIIGKDIQCYGAVSVQTTRGCPFDCNFCDVIYTNGRKPRNKSIDQVLNEIKFLEKLNAKMIFIADDNFIGDKKYAKELLSELVKINNSFRIPPGYMTQVDITLAQDDEILELMADCNFIEVMIGIESVNEDSLIEYNKKQNLNINISEAVLKIQSYGIVVLAHLIVGSDSDTIDVFERTKEFIKNANIIQHFYHPLMAPPGTKLWYELKRKGRLVAPIGDVNDELDIVTNIMPKQMTRIQLIEGLANYWKNVNTPKQFMERAKGFIEGIKRKPKIKKPGLFALWKLRKMLFGVFHFYMFKVTPNHRKAFFSILKYAGKHGDYLIPKVIFLYTSFLMDFKRSVYDSNIALKHADWEKNNPEKIKILSSSLPVSQKIRDNSTLIFTTAYNRVRKDVHDNESLYRIVVEAMIDYNDRFSETFETFNKLQEDYVIKSCERILSSFHPVKSFTTSELPENRLPAGFVREILDALDAAIRIKETEQ